jgi:RNA polymerase sigma-70 factor, ECF subfamily
VVRWLAKARQALLAQMRDILMPRLKVTTEELHSIVRLVQSQVDLTLGDVSS